MALYFSDVVLCGFPSSSHHGNARVQYCLRWICVFQAVSLKQKGSLEPDEKYPYWPLRTTRDEAIKRFGYFHPKDDKPAADSRVTLEIEVSGDGLCSLWPEVITVEPGSPAHRFKLNGTLYMHLVSPGGDPLYSVFMNLE